MARDSQRDMTADDGVMRLARRYSTAIVLFHHAVAEALGLGPTDHKCLELLRERGAMTGSQLAAVTGLTTGAISGVVARLERGGFVRRTPDPDDARKQILRPVARRVDDIQQVLAPFRQDYARILQDFNAQQMKAIVAFLDHGATTALRHAALLRAHAAATGKTAQGEGALA